MGKSSNDSWADYLRVAEWSSAVDKTPTHRPPINIYRANGEEIGKPLLQEGFARTWNPKRRNECGSP
ncbi:hypothetical protein GFL51_25140 [Rhizobium leguminosarum bv. viciae]|nr:hypothetical protein [Rhizobium leguminosarum bv. viciae]